MASYQDIHLISWNVAGLKPTLDFMRRFGGLKEFCKRHRVDILCLQEVKVTSKTLAQGRQYEVDGYESYWACNDGNGFQRQGLNGCATLRQAMQRERRKGKAVLLAGGTDGPGPRSARSGTRPGVR